MNGLTYTEVILGILIPLILGAYAHSWYSNKSLWQGIKDLRDELRADLGAIRANELAHLEERVSRLEDHK